MYMYQQALHVYMYNHNSIYYVATLKFNFDLLEVLNES